MNTEDLTSVWDYGDKLRESEEPIVSSTFQFESVSGS